MTLTGVGENYTYFTYAFSQSGQHIAKLKTIINPESSTQTEFITNFPGTTCYLIEDNTIQTAFSTILGWNLQIYKDSVWKVSDTSGNGPISVATNDCYRQNGRRISESGFPIPDPVCCASLNPVCDATFHCVGASYHHCKNIVKVSLLAGKIKRCR
mgnify:CR=1 FL=1